MMIPVNILDTGKLLFLGILAARLQIILNPPFSLFREYVAVLVEHKKKYLIIGNVNAVKYKEIFPLFMKNELWLGASIHSGDRAFFVPDNYPLDASGCGIDEETGRKFIRVKGVRWFTNMDIKQRHEELILVKRYNPDDYPIYDNMPGCITLLTTQRFIKAIGLILCASVAIQDPASAYFMRSLTIR